MPNPLLPQKKFPVFDIHFSALEDPRRTTKGNLLHPLNEILFLAISAVISGADGWADISEFGKTKLDWLRNYYPYENRTPSHDTLGKVFACIDHVHFAQCFADWVKTISQYTNGEVVAIDGKTMCGSGDTVIGRSALHIVSAYATENGLCLGQQVVGDKSNEITAIPELLETLAINGCIVTIDAMGCQRKIARQIIEKEADYILMVKDNQKELKEQVEKLFSRDRPVDEDKQVDVGHGRVETRKCAVIDRLDFLDGKEQWHSIRSIIKIDAERYSKHNRKTSRQTRYYISSLPANAEKINGAVRQHWSIENNLHWNLDVIFGEDASLKRKGNSAINYNVILKLALALIDREKSRKLSKPSKRLKAALDDNYRSKILKC